MYNTSKWVEVIEFNQSPIFSIGSYTWHTKLYELKGSTRSSTCHNSSPIFWQSSPSKVATFDPIEEAIDVLTMDVLIDANTSSSFGRSSCHGQWVLHWPLALSDLEHQRFLDFSPENDLSFSKLESYYWKPFYYYFPCDITNFLFVHLWWAWVVQFLG